MSSSRSHLRIAYLFPGQGAQYPGMGGDFVAEFSAARLTFEEADTILQRSLSQVILEGSQELLSQTYNSQASIYTVGIAIWRVVQELFELQPTYCAGLSLGEYTGLTAAGMLSFREALPLVERRGRYMQEACLAQPGTMAVVMGLSATTVEELVNELQLPEEIWVANFNCPGQVVISGTIKGVQTASEAARLKGAKRVLPLEVSGAFHSGLMRTAQEQLTSSIENIALKQTPVKIAMNVPGYLESDLQAVRNHLVQQVTHSVRWEQSIQAIEHHGVDLYVEFGPGRTLSGMNKRIGVKSPTISIETVADLATLQSVLQELRTEENSICQS